MNCDSVRVVLCGYWIKVCCIPAENLGGVKLQYQREKCFGCFSYYCSNLYLIIHRWVWPGARLTAGGQATIERSKIVACTANFSQYVKLSTLTCNNFTFLCFHVYDYIFFVDMNACVFEYQFCYFVQMYV